MADTRLLSTLILWRPYALARMYVDYTLRFELLSCIEAGDRQQVVRESK